MKNKVIAVVMVAFLVFTTACATKTKRNPVNISRMVVVEEAGIFNIAYDSETKVMYAISNGGYNHGTFTLLVDADGKPLLYREEQENE